MVSCHESSYGETRQDDINIHIVLYDGELLHDATSTLHDMVGVSHKHI